MHDTLFLHFQHDLARRIEEYIGTKLNLSLPPLHFAGIGEIHLDFSDREELETAIDAFSTHPEVLQELEIDRIRCEYRGELYCEYSIAVVSETLAETQSQSNSDSVKEVLNKIVQGQRGGKKHLDRKLWEKLA